MYDISRVLHMILNFLLFIAGVLLIIGGANYLTEGAAFLARKIGVTPLVVGLTVVAFGTSAPELVVSLTSALKGSADIAVGNVVGSNIFNILMITGIAAMITPLSVTRGTIYKEIPLMILSFVVMAVMCMDSYFDGSLALGGNVITRSEGLILIAFFLIFLSYTFSIAKKHSGPVTEPSHKYPVWLAIVFLVGGIAGLIFGGNLFVDSSVKIARGFGVSEAFIGLTLVAFGTSLPELATSIVAALKKEHDIAIGNVVGSSLFNVFSVLGISASISPIHVSGITLIDLMVMIFSGLLLYLVGVFFGDKTIKRSEGTVLVLVFILYMVYLGINL